MHFILVDLVECYGEEQAGTDPKREWEEAKDIDLRGVDVCMDSRYEAGSQDRDNWGNVEQKLIPGASHAPGWIALFWQWYLADPLLPALQIPSGLGSQYCNNACWKAGRFPGRNGASKAFGM